MAEAYLSYELLFLLFHLQQNADALLLALSEKNRSPHFELADARFLTNLVNDHPPSLNREFALPFLALVLTNAFSLSPMGNFICLGEIRQNVVSISPEICLHCRNWELGTGEIRGTRENNNQLPTTNYSLPTTIESNFTPIIQQLIDYKQI